MKNSLLLSGICTIAFSIAMVVFAGTSEASNSDPENKSPKPSNRSVSSTPRESILAISAKIDALVDSKLASIGQKRNAQSTDEIFLRRAYLDIIGRIPTLTETKAFLAEKSKTKREDLIDELLDSYGYTSRQYNYWADLLRIKSNLPGGLTGQPYIDFVKASLEQNKPYDEFVREMIGSNGPNLQRDNGGVGYYLRDRNMPEDNMSNTIRIFLGTRLECAQCHDHPFDKWTQRQYFEMVAFTGGINYRAGGSNSGMFQKIRKQYRSGDVPEKLRPVLNRMTQTMQHGVRGGGTGLARLPENFLGDDGFEGEIIIAKEMFEGKALTKAKVPTVRKKRNTNRKKKQQQQAFIPGSIDIGSRQVYSQWLTDRDNPRFAQVIANRLWKQALGVGLIEPVDIIEDETEASNPELMAYLSKTMLDLDFDMKQFLRAIYNTKTYQALAYRSDIPDPAKFCFNGPKVRRMSAEQIWDSLLTLTVPNTDKQFSQVDGRFGDPYELYEKMLSAESPEHVLEMAQEIADQRNKGRRKVNFRDDPAYKKLVEQKSALNRKLRAARKKKDTDTVRQIMAEQAKMTNDFRRKRSVAQFQRASEMRSPAPPGHFLREFGQSDREVIENSNTEPAVTQVLSMMNGYVEERIARDQSSVLMQAGIQAKGSRDCVETVFLSMLNRKPKSQERNVWIREFDNAFKRNEQGKVKEIFSDLIWTLANSNEFIFIK